MRKYEYKIKVQRGKDVYEILSYVLAPQGFMLEVNENDELCLIKCPHLDIVPKDKDMGIFQCNKCGDKIYSKFLMERIVV